MMWMLDLCYVPYVPQDLFFSRLQKFSTPLPLSPFFPLVCLLQAWLNSIICLHKRSRTLNIKNTFSLKFVITDLKKHLGARSEILASFIVGLLSFLTKFPATSSFLLFWLVTLLYLSGTFLFLHNQMFKTFCTYTYILCLLLQWKKILQCVLESLPPLTLLRTLFLQSLFLLPISSASPLQVCHSCKSTSTCLNIILYLINLI